MIKKSSKIFNAIDKCNISAGTCEEVAVGFAGRNTTSFNDDLRLGKQLMNATRKGYDVFWCTHPQISALCFYFIGANESDIVTQLVNAEPIIHEDFTEEHSYEFIIDELEDMSA